MLAGNEAHITLLNGEDSGTGTEARTIAHAVFIVRPRICRSMLLQPMYSLENCLLHVELKADQSTNLAITDQVARANASTTKRTTRPDRCLLKSAPGGRGRRGEGVHY